MTPDDLPAIAERAEKWRYSSLLPGALAQDIRRLLAYAEHLRAELAAERDARQRAVADERERCARLCEEHADDCKRLGDALPYTLAGYECAVRIRKP